MVRLLKRSLEQEGKGFQQVVTKEPPFNLVLQIYKNHLISKVIDRLNQICLHRFNHVFKIFNGCISAAHQCKFFFKEVGMIKNQISFCLVFITCAVLLLGCTNNKTATETTTVNADTAKAAVPSKAGTSNILFFGTSLTAGMGVDPEQAFPALIQKKIDSIKLPYKVINAGLSGETSADGKNRIDWLLRQPVAVFVLELGANDGLRGIPVQETVNNLQITIDKVKKKYPKVKLVLAGMQMPPSMGEKYTVPFRELYPALAKRNNMALVPFLLKDVAGIPSLIQQDGLHPNPKGHQILADNVWTILQPVL